MLIKARTSLVHGEFTYWKYTYSVEVGCRLGDFGGSMWMDRIEGRENQSHTQTFQLICIICLISLKDL